MERSPLYQTRILPVMQAGNHHGMVRFDSEPDAVLELFEIRPPGITDQRRILVWVLGNPGHRLVNPPQKLVAQPRLLRVVPIAGSSNVSVGQSRGANDMRQRDNGRRACRSARTSGHGRVGPSGCAKRSRTTRSTSGVTGAASFGCASGRGGAGAGLLIKSGYADVGTRATPSSAGVQYRRMEAVNVTGNVCPVCLEEMVR